MVSERFNELDLVLEDSGFTFDEDLESWVLPPNQKKASDTKIIAALFVSVNQPIITNGVSVVVAAKDLRFGPIGLRNLFGRMLPVKRLAN